MSERVWLQRSGATHGPYAIEQLRAWIADGTVSASEQAYSASAGWTTVARVVGTVPHAAMPPPPAMTPAAPSLHEDEAIVRRIAEYERIAAIVWAVIALVQIVSVVTIIAGLWNAYAAYTRFRLVPQIEARNRHIPPAFESVSGLLIIGAINVFLGAIFGVVGIVMDFVVRDYVLKHRHLFDREAEALQV